MQRYLFLLALLVLSVVANAQHTISGTIIDEASGETLIGATVLDQLSGKGTVTNVSGHYSLTLKSDTAHLRITFVGYEPQYYGLKLKKNEKLNVALRSSLQLQEVVITAERAGDVRSSQMSAIDVPIERLKSVPVLFGEADIVKALQLMPGVQSGSEGNSGFYVRGGGPDENLFLLDGVPLYNVNHLGGFFSAFNTDAVKNVTLYKGSFPARFGGRLSSVLDVTTNNGNDKAIHGNASVGFISAKIGVEGPIVKERTTFSFSARRTYADLLLQPLVRQQSKTEDGKSKLNAGYYFYDLNAKLTHKFSDRSRLFGTFYCGSDYVYGRVRTVSSLGEEQYLNINNRWGNLVGAIRWNYELSPKLFLNLTGAYTQYDNNIILGIEKVAMIDNQEQISTVSADYNSGIKDVSMRLDFDYTPNPDHNVKFGSSFIRHWFMPEVASASIDYYDQIQMNGSFKMDTNVSNSAVPANEITLFAEDDWAINDHVKINYGLHLSGFKVENSFYASPEPRLSARWLVNDDLSVKAGYAYMTQYLHLLSTTNVSLSTDLWVPATDRIKPMNAHQLAAGVFYSKSGIADFGIEAYYKRMSDLIEYKDGASFFGISTGWEDLVVAGDGYAYGVEFLVQRNIGKLTGWVGYTWSRTMHLFNRDGAVLNHGDPFPAKYDRRHDLSIVLSYKFSERFDLSATWVFSTGNAATLALYSYSRSYEDPDEYGTAAASRQSLSYITDRNNFRLPNYHRMDVSVNFHRQFKKCRRTINVSVYNLYNRKNPYMIYQSSEYQYAGFSSALVQLSLFPILPSVAYTLYF